MKAKNTKTSNNKIDLNEAIIQSSANNKTYLTAFVLLILSVVTIVSLTTDSQLLIPNSPVPMPFIDINIPLRMFFFIAPLFVFVLHLNLLHNLELHHSKLIIWSKTFNQNIPKINLQPNIYDSSILDIESKYRVLVKFFSDLLFLYSSPLTLIAVFWRFSSYQNFIFSFYHFILVILDLLVVTVFLKSVNRKKTNVILLFILSLIPFSLIFFVSFFNSNILWNFIDGKIYNDQTISYDLKVGNKNEDGSYELANHPTLSLFLPRISLDASDYLNVDLNTRNNDLKISKPTYNLDLKNRNLRGAILRNINFSNSNFQGAKFEGANFDESTLENADFRHAFINGASFNNAKMMNVKLDHAEINRCDFHRADLSKAHFEKVESIGSIYTNATMTDSIIAYSNFTDSNFYSAHLVGAILQNTNFAGADFAFAELILAHMATSHFEGTNFGKANLFLADLSYTHLQGSLLNDANFDGVDFSEAEMQGANILNSDFTAAIFKNTKTKGLRFENAKGLDKIQNADIDNETNIDWDVLLKLSNKDSYKSMINVGKNYAENATNGLLSKVEYNPDSLTILLPKICSHGLNALNRSIYTSMVNHIEPFRDEYGIKENTKTAANMVPKIKECRVHLNSFKSHLKENLRISDFDHLAFK